VCYLLAADVQLEIAKEPGSALAIARVPLRLLQRMKGALQSSVFDASLLASASPCRCYSARKPLEWLSNAAAHTRHGFLIGIAPGGWCNSGRPPLRINPLVVISRRIRSMPSSPEVCACSSKWVHASPIGPRPKRSWCHYSAAEDVLVDSRWHLVSVRLTAQPQSRKIA
jgi:hypothetical protein